MKYLSKLFLYIYERSFRLKGRAFSWLVARTFASFGRETILMCPIRLSGESRIAIGEDVFVGADCWLHVMPDGNNQSVAISIGSGSSMAGACVISAARSVCLEEGVLLARNVYIADHRHRFSETDIPIINQGIENISPVLVKRGAWLGQNVVVCPGVTIGRGAVIGANSVVTQDIPDFSIAVGAPARVVKMIEMVGA